MLTPTLQQDHSNKKRTISNPNTIEKLRILDKLETNLIDYKNGARTYRSTTDNLFILRAQIDYYYYYNIPMTIYYDPEEAFDKFWLKDCPIDL